MIHKIKTLYYFNPIILIDNKTYFIIIFDQIFILYYIWYLKKMKNECWSYELHGY